MIHPASVHVAALHRLLGANLISKDRTRFCVWAPTIEQVFVELIPTKRRIAMDRIQGGYHVAEIDGVAAGELYQYLPISTDRRGEAAARPDPAARFQPQGVHGPSMVVDQAFPW
ncbi:MAG: hypothetical protein JJ992_08430, partial [Planctomycetes bacterium]|nr:hypothetical protein [Planctomycetota bacterium]